MLWPMICLVVAYPALTHAAVWFDKPLLQWLALTVLAATGMYDALRLRRLWAWAALALTSAALYGLVQAGGGIYALYLQPILLPASLFGLFAYTLRAGATPLVTRFATLARGPLPPDLARYTARVTAMWCITFALLVASAALCAIYASRATWSIMTNLVHYLFLGAVFLGEYLARLYKFRHLDHPGFLAYLRVLLSTRMRSL